MKRLAILGLTFWICGPPGAVWAHGVVGDYTFLEPLVAEDPTPANEFDVLVPGWNKSNQLFRNFYGGAPEIRPLLDYWGLTESL